MWEALAALLLGWQLLMAVLLHSSWWIRFWLVQLGFPWALVLLQFGQLLPLLPRWLFLGDANLFPVLLPLGVGCW